MLRVQGFDLRVSGSEIVAWDFGIKGQGLRMCGVPGWGGEILSFFLDLQEPQLLLNVSLTP